MALTPWEPLSELRQLRDMMDRFFEEPYTWPPGRQMMRGIRTLPIDIYETPNEVVIKTTVAGVKPENVDISVSGNILTIRAERKEEAEIPGAESIRRERFYGRFERSITLPAPVLADKAQATFQNGELTLHLPKAEEAKAKHIKVQVTKM